ncbi:hypothetical protein ACVK00_003474 [Burkholderia sp. PvR073]|uniref:hypothetical protein n=1 Tax=Burkholderia TaxID=32008 RepID=UPI00254ED22F|nr:hypothetical protein [Burkholderia sp. lyk4-R2A-23]
MTLHVVECGRGTTDRFDAIRRRSEKTREKIKRSRVFYLAWRSTGRVGYSAVCRAKPKAM